MKGYAAYAYIFRVGSAILITLVRGYPSGMIPQPLAVPQQKQATQRHGIREQHHFAMLKSLSTCRCFNFSELQSRIPLLADTKLRALIQRRVRACLLSALLPIMSPTTVPKLWIVVPNRTPATFRHFHIGRYRSRATLLDWTIWFPSLACIVSERYPSQNCSTENARVSSLTCILVTYHIGHSPIDLGKTSAVLAGTFLRHYNLYTQSSISNTPSSWKLPSYAIL